MVYSIDLKQLQNKSRYTVDRSGEITDKFDRIAYFMELQRDSDQTEWVWVSMDAFTTDVKKIGIPLLKTGAFFQTSIRNLTVKSNVKGLAIGSGIAGNMEFWPNNYGPGNQRKIPGASSTMWDFGDETTSLENGYGSMQIHNTKAKQTVFSLNHWNSSVADVGIGNSTGKTRDWTFTGSAATILAGRLRVFVRKIAK